MGAGYHGGFGNGTRGAVIEKAYRISNTTYCASDSLFSDNGTVGSGGFQSCNRDELTFNVLVRTLVEKKSYPAGTLGIVVDICIQEESSDVLLLDEHSNPTEILTYLFNEIEVVG